MLDTLSRNRHETIHQVCFWKKLSAKRWSGRPSEHMLINYMTWPCNGKMLTRGRVDIGLFPVGLMTCGQPNCSRNHPKRGDLFELWVWRLLRTKCHVLILLFSEVSGKFTFPWLGPGVSWRLPPPLPLPSVIFLARQGCYPKLELKSVVELCCHVFDIISFQHSCTVDRCMDCNLSVFTLHESHLQSLQSPICMHQHTESVVHAMDGSPAKPAGGTSWSAAHCCGYPQPTVPLQWHGWSAKPHQLLIWLRAS